MPLLRLTSLGQWRKATNFPISRCDGCLCSDWLLWDNDERQPISPFQDAMVAFAQIGFSGTMAKGNQIPLFRVRWLPLLRLTSLGQQRKAANFPFSRCVGCLCPNMMKNPTSRPDFSLCKAPLLHKSFISFCIQRLISYSGPFFVSRTVTPMAARLSRI